MFIEGLLDIHAIFHNDQWRRWDEGPEMDEFWEGKVTHLISPPKCLKQQTYMHLGLQFVYVVMSL